MERTKWTDRKFTFDFPAGWMPDILERLHGTGPRITEMTRGIPESKLESAPVGRWSIKEHIGHLSDLEELHMGRLDDFAGRKNTIRAADMSNAKTYAAQHNKKSSDELIAEFIEKRRQFIDRLAKLDDETQLFSAMHPRLNTLMRPVDVAYFTAEHDDHHLASMREIVNAQDGK